MAKIDGQPSTNPSPNPQRTQPVDEFAVNTFETLGFKQPFPPLLVYAYNAFKAVRDQLQPGRLTPEGFATVISIYNWTKDRPEPAK